MTEDRRLRLLLEAAVSGDQHAVSELVRCTQPAVWRVCSALGTPGDEADLVQETYLRALRALPTYRGASPVMVWLASIARRVCADEVRRRRRRRQLLERISRQGREQPESGPSWVGDLLDELDDDRREAFVLTQVLDLSYAEAAAVVGCPIGTIRSRVARARADLAALLARAEAR